MKVSDEIKEAYKSNSIHKTVILEFPDLKLTIPHKQIYSESLRLKESLVSKKNIEFVGCIASSFEIQVHGVSESLKNQRIKVSIQADGTDPIPLFNGIVDSAKMQTNKQYKKIVAYDELYTKGSVEVASWYKSLTFPVTLKDLRDSLFKYIGLEQVDTILPNDSIQIDRQYDPKTLKSLNVIKAICQINGAFGIINREELFEYRILGDLIDIPYPSTMLFPSATLFPGTPEPVALSIAQRVAEEVEAENFSFYKTVDYEEYEVKPVDKLTIRQSEDDAGVSYGSGTNNYIIQGNMFTYNLDDNTRRTIARNIYPNVKGFSYHPFKSDNNGLPFLECGLDGVSYAVIDYDNSTSGNVVHTQMPFYILNREMSGIQSLRDKYDADGEEYQTEFITDLQTQIDTLKRDDTTKDYVKDYVNDYTYDKDTLDEMFAGGGGGGFIFESVNAPPVGGGDPNTVYLITGIVMVD